MPVITLPDGSSRQYQKSITVQEVANDIGSGLERAAIAAMVDNQLVDLSHMIDRDAKLAILTDKNFESLAILRHSTAHLMAHAVKQLFPEAQVTIGPTIDNGFYYDFAYGKPFTPEDLEKITKRMQELAKKNIKIIRKEMPRDDAIAFFKKQGEKYKAEIISEIPVNENISLYEQDDFVDLCRGPHVPNTEKIKHFKLMKIAGAYWRGDSNNEMLQRIYGTAWFNKKDLDDYLNKLEEAEKRDHRKIGKTLDLFHMQEEAPGMVFWHDKGWIIYRAILEYMRKRLREYDYQEVFGPLILDRSLWEKSGHWDKFGAKNMFTTTSENREYAIKPMNCIGHLQIYNQGLKSYRDLPLRMAEFGLCHRNELSGALHGLMRIREFIQDDAHIFCTEKHLQQELIQLIDLIYRVYKDFGFENVIIHLSTRPEKRIGDDRVWDMAEKALEHALRTKKLPFEIAPGEGAFYGPKIDFHLKDCIDRVWQCGTIQVDFSMPKRLGAEYVAEDGTRQIPIMIHRTLLGSIERFIGVLIEHYAGNFPLWLAPIQVVLMNITDKQADFVTKITKTLKKHDIRAVQDLRNEKIGFKIREHTLQKVPYLVIIGDKEVESGQLSVRTQKGEDLGTLSLEAFIGLFKQEE